LSPRAAKMTIVLLIVATLFATAYIVLPRLGTGHPIIDTVNKIVYLSNADSQNVPHVFIVGADGVAAKDLTPGSQNCADPTFSPDGSQIAYVSDKQGQSQIYIVNADGTHPHAITFGSASKSSPQFTPNGKSLTYLEQGTVTSIDLQSNDTELLLPSPGAATSSSTASLIDISNAPVLRYSWSPTSPGSNSHESQLAAVQESVESDEQVLTLLPSVSASPIELISATNISFCWSPDGTQIYAAILGGRAGTKNLPFSGIVTFDSSGRPVQRPPLLANRSLSIGPTDPFVSPDGTQIAFSVVNNPDLAHTRTLGLFMEPIDGSVQPKALMNGPVKFAQWSPDGSKMLLLLPQHGASGQDLWVASMVSSNSVPINITLGSGDVTSADWSPSVSKTD
jgi:Tol biopolymer transport system component